MSTQKPHLTLELRTMIEDGLNQCLSLKEIAEIESAHRFIRRVLPKGTSFDSQSQDRVSLLSSHINSYNRVSLNNQSPFDLFKLLYGQNALTQLGLCRIPSDKILLSPVLLGD